MLRILTPCLLVVLASASGGDVPTTSSVDDTPHSNKCICKPTVNLGVTDHQLERPHTAPICNNATMQWLLNTVMEKVNNQQVEIVAKESQISQLVEHVSQMGTQLQQTESLRQDNERISSEWKESNSDLKRQFANATETMSIMEQQNKNLEMLNSELTLKNEHLSDDNAKMQTKLQRMIEENQKTKDLEELNSKLNLENVRLMGEFSKMHRNLHVLQEREKVSQSQSRAKDCADIHRQGYTYSGVYTIYPGDLYSQTGMDVFCDLHTDGGGWLVFQRRQDGSIDFRQNWDKYKWGFGMMAKEFWLGNELLHNVTDKRIYELRVDLTDVQGKHVYAAYDFFHVDAEIDMYKLHIGKYSGNAGDSLRHHNDQPFSTTDVDNDQSRSGNCAELFGGGGWWYVRCYDANLNGIYRQDALDQGKDGIVWFHYKHDHIPFKHAEMKIRPVGYGAMKKE